MKKTILIVILTFAIGVQAQEVKTLTLKDAITDALENKADARKAKLQVEDGGYEGKEVRARS